MQKGRGHLCNGIVRIGEEICMGCGICNGTVRTGEEICTGVAPVMVL